LQNKKDPFSIGRGYLYIYINRSGKDKTSFSMGVKNKNIGKTNKQEREDSVLNGRGYL
jgi:hypothetical protein